MARISGLARSTIYRGVSDIRDKASAPPGRVRKPGAGRKSNASKDRTLVADLKRLVEPATRGDPMQPLLWTSRSLRNLARALARQGHQACHTVVGELLQAMGYRLQANSKTREGGQHIDRDAQFQYINTQAVAFLAAHEPIISVDTKKKELVGNFKNNGREWRPKGKPEQVNVHDFIDPKLSRAVPYGVYDIANNAGWVSVGTDHDTASFAVNAIRRWWRTMGRKSHPKATRLMISRRRRRQQRLSRAVVEGRTSETGRRAQAAHHGLPPAARHQQVEQDRASSLLVHHNQLARQALAQLSYHRRTDRRHNNRHRTQGSRRTRRKQVSQGRQNIRTLNLPQSISLPTPSTANGTTPSPQFPTNSFGDTKLYDSFIDEA